MKLLESKIFDFINTILSFIQSLTENITQNSFIISNLNFFIIISIIATYITSTFAETTLIATVSFFVPILVFIKTLLTKGEKVELEFCNFYLLIYLIICFISNFTSSMPFQSLYGFMKTLIYFAFYFALCHFLKRNKNYIIILLFIIASLVSIESIIAIIQNTVGLENIATWQDTSYVNPEHILSRVYGTLKPYNPNLFAGFLIAGISSLIAIISFFIQKKEIKTAIFFIVLFLTSIFAIFLTGCRGAYIALFGIFVGIIISSFQIIFYDFKNPKLQKLWKTIITFGCFCSVLFMMINQSIFKRLMSIFLLRGDSSTSFRMNVYNSSIQMFQDNWLCGIGVGNKVFREIYGLYMISGFDALSCYCVFLELAVESGILALITYLLFLGTLLKAGVKKFIKTNDLSYKVLLFVTFISIVSVMIHGLFDTIYFRPQIQYIFWTMAAILTVLTREEKAK